MKQDPVTLNGPGSEEVLATLKPSLRSTLPAWVGYSAAAVALTLAMHHNMNVVVWFAQHIANLIGDAFPYNSWYFWLVLLIWLACLSRPAYASLILWSTEYQFTKTRLRYTRGILHRQRDQLEIARIRDLTATRRLIERLLGLGTLRIESVDRTHPILDIPGQRDVYALKDWVHELNMQRRIEMGYREFEGTQSLG